MLDNHNHKSHQVYIDNFFLAYFLAQHQKSLIWLTHNNFSCEISSADSDHWLNSLMNP